MEKQGNKSWFILSTPAVIAALYLSLRFFAELPPAMMLFMIPLTSDAVMSKLLVLLISQLIGVGIIIYVIIPFLRVRNVDFKAISYSSFLKCLAILCLFWVISVFSDLVFSFLASTSNIKASNYSGTLPLSTNQLGNLVNIFIWLTVFTLGTAVFKEYWYRRTLIPLLEERGTSPFVAVVASSLAFALVTIPGDLGIQVTIIDSNHLNVYLRYDPWTSLFVALDIFWSAFILPISCNKVMIKPLLLLYPFFFLI